MIRSFIKKLSGHYHPYILEIEKAGPTKTSYFEPCWNDFLKCWENQTQLLFFNYESFLTSLVVMGQISLDTLLHDKQGLKKKLETH